MASCHALLHALQIHLYILVNACPHHTPPPPPPPPPPLPSCLQKLWVDVIAGASDNTQAALHFANAAKRVTMQPRVNEIVRDKALLRHLQLEIKALRTQLVRIFHNPLLQSHQRLVSCEYRPCAKNSLTQAVIGRREGAGSRFLATWAFAHD